MRRLVLAAVLSLLAGNAASAATPQPAATSARINVEQLQPRGLAPKKKLHVELTVEVNRLGQVTRVRSIVPSHDQAFDAHTYGNALQTFIRTSDGRVVVGTYRLLYDYDPSSLRVHRDVVLIKPGGVNPNAKGAAIAMMEIARRNAARKPAPAAATPNPAPSVRHMPDLPQVMQTPSH